MMLRGPTWSGVLALWAFAAPVSSEAQQGRWAGFYDAQVLEYWNNQMQEGIRANYEEVLLRALRPDERAAMGKTVLAFPLEDSDSLINFYSAANTVFMPISSLRFLADICLAYAWLSLNRHDLQVVTDYLSIVEQQWPDMPQSARHLPLDALHIPPSARQESRVMARMQTMFGSAVVFVLGHELGHLRYGHQKRKCSTADLKCATDRMEQNEEREADAFALELMARAGAPPHGASILFTIFAHTGPLTVDLHCDANGQRALRSSTVAERECDSHPLSFERLTALASSMRARSADFVRSTERPKTAQEELLFVAGEIEKIAAILADEGVQALIRQRGLTMDLATLTKAGSATAELSGLFQGSYTGRWVDPSGRAFDGFMVLRRDGQRVRGTYTFAGGAVSLSGSVTGQKLVFEWKWTPDYFGTGTLLDDGRALVGDWKPKRSDARSGRWELRRAK